MTSTDRPSLAFREIRPAQLPRFVDRGYRERQFFPHRTYTLPKCGPDAVELSNSMVGENAAEAYWVLTLHATGDVLQRFPAELFFDDDVVWHRQHYGLPGHIAFAMFVTRGQSMFGLNYVSDIVQRQAHAQAHRTQIQARFNGWAHMLLNALLGFAIEHDIETVYSPTADLALRNTDPQRFVNRDLFERVYDAAVADFFAARRRDDWWVIDVGENRARAIAAERRSAELPSEKAICITHDTERGLGHVEADLPFARLIHRASERHLDRMLAEERRAGIRATYNVVGCLYDEVKDKIAADGHCVAFHSYDHLSYPGAAGAGQADLPERAAALMPTGGPGAKHFTPGTEQLTRCRSVDYRTRGYRVPNSRLTPELTPQRLLRSNYDWLANADSSIRSTVPVYRDNIVFIPVMFDDFALHTGEMDYPAWQAWAFECLRDRNFVAFGLHDCYGAYWLDRYADFLEQVAAMGTLRTCDEIADHVVLAHCV